MFSWVVGKIKQKFPLIRGLFNDTIESNMVRWPSGMMNGQRLRRKGSWRISGIVQEFTRKDYENPRRLQNNHCQEFEPRTCQI
jgi:hypothetical protein